MEVMLLLVLIFHWVLDSLLLLSILKKITFVFACMEMVQPIKDNYMKLLIWPNFGIFLIAYTLKITDTLWEHLYADQPLILNTTPETKLSQAFILME